RGADRARLALRPAARRGAQAPSAPEARGLAQGQRQAAPVSEGCARRRDRGGRSGRDQAAAARPERLRGHRGIHREVHRAAMNKGLLSVDEALERVLAGARPVAETETVPTLSAAGRVLAIGQRSTMNVPPLDNSAMDG